MFFWEGLSFFRRDEVQISKNATELQLIMFRSSHYSSARPRWNGWFYQVILGFFLFILSCLVSRGVCAPPSHSAVPPTPLIVFRTQRICSNRCLSISYSSRVAFDSSKFRRQSQIKCFNIFNKNAKCFEMFPLIPLIPTKKKFMFKKIFSQFSSIFCWLCKAQSVFSPLGCNGFITSLQQDIDAEAILGDLEGSF